MEFDLLTAGIAVLSAGSAWGGTVVAQRGIKEKVTETAATLAHHTDADHKMQLDTVGRLARIEALLIELKDK